MHPDLPIPALSTSPCVGVTGRGGKLGDSVPEGAVGSSGCRRGVPKHPGLLSEQGALTGISSKEQELVTSCLT